MTHDKDSADRGKPSRVRREPQKRLSVNPDARVGRYVSESREDFRAGAGGAPDESPGTPGGTLGTGGSMREQDR